ncbi:MAG: Ig-like domain-containing protein, partial [Clostridia bacterium]|nr:Ig-like domain-containing protein [Clostridia bacterium]
MKSTMKRITALVLCLAMLFGMIPADAASPWDPWGFLPFFSPWFDPVSGAELEEAKTVAESDDGTVILYVGEQKNWNGTLDNSNPNSDPSVATAEKSGDNQLLIKAQNKDGFTTLRLTGTAFCTVRVIKPSVELTKSMITVEPGSEYYLRAKTNCRDQDGDGTLTWSSSNESVVTVDDTGKLTIGTLADNQDSATATITCEMKYTTHDPDGTKHTKYVSTECDVIVKRFLRSIVLDASNLEMYTDDEPVTVNITGCNPAYFYTDETIEAMDIYSTKTSVLEVAANGKELILTPKGKGTAKVVVSYINENGEPVEAYIIVKVLDEGLEISPAYMELPAGSVGTVVADVHPARKSGSVKVTSSDPKVATVEWNAGDMQAVVRGLTEGTAELTFTMGTLQRTAKVTITEPVDADKDLYTVSFLDYDGKVLCTKETVLSTAEEPNYVTIPDVDTVRDGYKFDHFERDNAPGVAYYAGDELEVTANMTLTAVYVPGTCTITYANTSQSAGYGIDLPAAEQVSYGELATKPTYGIGSDGKAIEKEVRENNQSRYYRFIGWQTEDGTKYTFTDPVMSSLTLYPIWDKVYCVITVRTFKGAYPDHDTGITTVEKGAENVTISDLKMFTASDGDFYTYTYTNANGVGKVVYFQFWQYGSERITSGSYHFDKVMEDATFTAVYEPGNPRSVGGPAVNDSTSSYYHSTNVYVPINWKRVDNDAVVLDDMVQTNVYPQYGLKTSNVYGMQYEYRTSRDEFPDQDKWDQLGEQNFEAGGKYYNVSGNDTAKYGLVNLSDMVGQEITGTDGKNYIVTGIDQSKVEAVWLCTCDGHTFNGYCLGGTWNAIGQVTLYVEEKPRNAPKIKVNYYLLPTAETEEQRDAYRKGIVTQEQKDKARPQDITSGEIPVDEVLTYKDYVSNISGIWPAVDHDWISGTEGQLTTENGEYVLNLYYADIYYRVKVYYHYVKNPGDAGNTDAPLVPAKDLGKNGVNPWTNNDFHYYYNDKFSKDTPYIDGYVADRTVVSGTFTDHDIEEHVYYEPIVTLCYKALIGGKVTTVEEKVRQFTGEAVGSTAVADTANGYVVKGWYAEEDCSSQLLDAGEQANKKFVPERPAAGWTDGTTFWAKFVKKIVITSASKTWAYDGSAHTEPVYTVTYGTETLTADAGSNGLVFTLPDTGDKLTIKPTAGGVTYTGDWEEGDDPNNLFSYTLEHAGEYSVSSVYGILDITPAVLGIASMDNEWIYDGSGHQHPVYSVTLNEETITDESSQTTIVLPTGDTLTLTATGTVTHVTDSDEENNTFSYDLDQHKDQYTVSAVYGDLAITPAPLEITTDSDTKVYDGDPLTADGKVEGFAETDSYTFTPTGSQTEVGSSENTYTLVFTGDTQETDYEIVKEDLGTLTVTPAGMSIESPDGEWTYDGTGHQT